MSEEVLRTTRWEPIAESHRMDLVRSSDEPPAELVTAVFALVVDGAGRVLLAQAGQPEGGQPDDGRSEQRRSEEGRSDGGWDVPGGHVRAGETPAAAACRALAEETGLELAEERVRVVGWTRTRFDGPCPAGWTYPYPDSYMVFYGARLADAGAGTVPSAGEAAPARELAEPTQPTESTVPTGPTVPTAPTGPMEATESTVPTESTGPMEATESTVPTVPMEATGARWLTPAEVDELVDHPEWLLLLRVTS